MGTLDISYMRCSFNNNENLVNDISLLIFIGSSL